MRSCILPFFVEFPDFCNNAVQVRDDGIDNGQLGALQDVSLLLLKDALLHDLARFLTFFQPFLAFQHKLLQSLPSLLTVLAGPNLANTLLEGA